MSSESDHQWRFGRPGTQAAGTSATNPDPIDASTGRPRRGATHDGRPAAGTRTRVVALRVEVEVLEAERATPANRVLAPEADVTELETEVAALERTVECEERRRQQVIGRYERIVVDREETNRELREEAATNGVGLRRVRPAIRSAVETACVRMRHLVPGG